MATEVNKKELSFYVVIPAHNEEGMIKKTLDSLVNQSLLPKKIIVVDDNSTDQTADIVTQFCQQFDFIDLLQNNSSAEHLPGSKVVRAFYKGLKELDEEYDVICKFDADLIFPKNYFETLNTRFLANPKIGMVGGFCSILKGEQWVREALTDSTHIRGALKAYRKACFKEIGGLKEAMGWDTLDELLAQYYGWKVETVEDLLVKHLRPTGASYKNNQQHIFGEALYRMHYGSVITFISSAKMAWRKKNISVLKNNMNGYFKAQKNELPYLVSEKEGRWIRKYRWKKMKGKLF